MGKIEKEGLIAVFLDEADGFLSIPLSYRVLIRRPFDNAAVLHQRNIKIAIFCMGNGLNITKFLFKVMIIAIGNTKIFVKTMI